MDVEALPIAGAWVLGGREQQDGRGWFRKLLEVSELAGRGMNSEIHQVASTFNLQTGTVRGLHYQVGPEAECKYVWCLSGSLVDVLVDLRTDEPGYGRWTAVELSADRPRCVYVPAGVAHGYQTTSPETTVLYLITAPYRAQGARSLRWDDPTIGISWPLPVTQISDTDAKAPPWPPRR